MGPAQGFVYTATTHGVLAILLRWLRLLGPKQALS
jgi:hypothetical protein